MAPSATREEAAPAVALDLLWRNGFNATTIQTIADASGISRRTVFRCSPSTDDIPWGRFDENLDHLGDRP